MNQSIFRNCLIWFFILQLSAFQSFAQTQDNFPDSLHKKRFIPITAAAATWYVGSLTFLSQAWYKDQQKTNFHFFNDNDEWLQMDKLGHGITSYYEGMYGYRMLRWSGVSEKKAIWFGGTFGLLMQTPIEVFDGFSPEYGASWGDLGANTFGTALFISQQLAWHEQKVMMKFSFMPTKYAALKPNLLGSNFGENVVKDYNGQTYWLSTNIRHIVPSKKIPRWLNVAVGYGGDGMLRGTYQDQKNDPNPNIRNYQRSRQYYLSLDVDLTQVHTKSKFVNSFCTAIAMIKIPSPTLEFYEREGFKFHYIYF
ncbi:MAG: DUF2279 domain-containing protein [Sphingobacteriales bacterium]|nr:MAG: DUF2279 domain-containing protein [Sphingobacteriales bacterium]